MVDPFQRRMVWYESGLERSWLQCLIANPDVVEVREQQEAKFQVAMKTRRHVFDVVIVKRSGWRTAGAVRYAEDVDEDLRRAVQQVAAQHGDAFADAYELLTEKELDRLTILNSRRIIYCAQDFDFSAQQRILDRLPMAPSEIHISEFDDLVGDGHRGSRAAIALLKSGALVAPPGMRLDRQAVLWNRFTK